MAGRNFDLSIIINALDKTKKTFEDLNKNLGLTEGQLTAVSVASTAAFAAMAYSLKKTADAAGIQQNAEINLANTMIRTGQYTKENFKSNIALASSLQQITKYGDEQIIAAQSLLATFIRDDDVVKQLTVSTLDLATAQKMDLKSAALMIAKSVGSSTNALQRYGVTIEGAVGSSARAESAITALSNLFAGRAEADAIGYTGAIQQSKNAFGDLQETIGFLVLPRFTEIQKSILANINIFRNWIDTHQALAKAVGGVSFTFIGLIALLSTTLLLLPKIIGGFKLLVTVINTNPYIALATILITLILNWNRLRDAMSDTSRAGQIIGKTMDILKASFFAIGSVLTALTYNFKALWSAMTLNFDQAKKDMQIAAKLISNIPKTVKDAYNDIDSTMKTSSKKRLSYEEDLNEKILSLIENNKTSNIETLTSMVEEEQALEDARIEYLLASNQMELEQYQEYLNQKLLAMGNFHLMSNEQQIAFYALQTQLANNQDTIDKKRMLSFKEAWKKNMTDIKNYQINWSDQILKVTGAMQGALSIGFQTVFKNIGDGWEALTKGMKAFGDALLNSMIMILADLAANWVLQHGIMIVATKAWAVASWLGAQAVAAAKVIAGWATIPFIGVALGLAAAAAMVSAMNGQFKMFATGTRGFGGGMALVGENGPELVNLPNGSDVLNNPETRNILNARGNSASGNAINVNIDFKGSTFMGTVDEITEALSMKIFQDLKFNAVI